jgi:hypothetical protein
LVLLSRHEVAPKVVLEAFAAGLNVVINERSAANLTDEEFITVLPGDRIDPDAVANAVGSAIESNERLRPQIVDYARSRFDYAVQIPNYLQAIDEFRAVAEAAR